MIRRLLCKLGFHNYQYTLTSRYYLTRYTDGWEDWTYNKRVITNDGIMEVCKWCGKVKEDSIKWT